MSYKIFFLRINTILLFLSSCTLIVKAQDARDMGKPINSPFQLQGDLTGAISNSVNQVTGKLAFSVPLASLKSGSLAYQVGLVYDGQSSFKIGKEQNTYSPSSTVGVGWSLPISKIIVDNKQTAAQDDDDFYIFDGVTSSKLICTKRGDETWDFQLEKYSPWIIKYYKRGSYFYQNPHTGNFELKYNKLDYWKIIKEDGNSYYFGYSDFSTSEDPFAPMNTSKSKEKIVAWGNWIGDSRSIGGSNHTIVWNLSRMRDQWGNYLDFGYEVNEIDHSGNAKQTESSYLKSISSSNGTNIKLIYDNKQLNEFFEPHTEINEPDAYQERYEKKFLKNIEVYNYKNQLTSNYDLGHILSGSGLNTKRYLVNITQTDYKAQRAESLPLQLFEYHLTGDYKGGLKKVTYPTGGSINYNYEKKSVFYNHANRFSVTPNSYPNYNYYSCYVANNYSLKVYQSSNSNNGKYNFKFLRHWWNGIQWESSEFNFPHSLNDNMNDFFSVMGDDFYAFAVDKGNQADLYIFHLQKNGSWDYSQYNNIPVGSGTLNLMAGNDFIALGAKNSGDLYTYFWNGSSYNYEKISQGGGTYYYAANNNFILSLDIDGGNDMITGVSYNDNYYIHYLDASKKWQTKSWSASHPDENPIGDSNIIDVGMFFPSNAMTGFMTKEEYAGTGDHYRQYFLRWDEDYEKYQNDNDFVFLGFLDPINPLIPVGNGSFTLSHNWYGFPFRSARFNGFNWNTYNLPSSSNYYAKLNFGNDIFTFQNHDNINGIGYQVYNPNTENFSHGTLNNSGYSVNHSASGITSEFIVAGDKIFKKSTQANFPSFSQIGNIGYDNDFTYTNGLSHAYVRHIDNSQEAGKLYYIKKDNGQLTPIPLSQENMTGRSTFGGKYNKFISLNSIWLKTSTSSTITSFLYRIIDDRINQQVYNNVIGSVVLDDDNGGIREIKITYDNPFPKPDNSIVNYAEVTIENKGFGYGNQGYKKSFYETGENDLQMEGLMLKEQVFDVDNNLEKETIFNWKKNNKNLTNEIYDIIDLGFYNVLTSKEESLFLENSQLSTTTDYLYNNLGQLTSVINENSKGEIERKSINYAHSNYSYMRNKNMMNEVYETYYYLDNELKSKEQNIYDNDNDRVYLKEKWSGTFQNLRLNTEITKVGQLGNLQEVTDGKSNYNCNLMAYSNLRKVATIKNAKFIDVINELDVSYNELQDLSTSSLKNELIKLYDRLPDSMISLNFYDDNGRIINQINERRDEIYFYYDIHGRLKYRTDKDGNLLEYLEYNFSNN